MRKNNTKFKCKQARFLRYLVFTFLFSLFTFLFSHCSFDYGTSRDDIERPDIIMHDVEYVRVRQGDPLVRFRAEYAERYEEQQIMNLDAFVFEEFQDSGYSVNTVGNAGAASIELDSGNVNLSRGVYIRVESEDITIETSVLRWMDNERQLEGGENEVVEIRRSDGTIFIGRGFNANAREQTWQFNHGVQGSYVDDDNTDDDNNEN